MQISRRDMMGLMVKGSAGLVAGGFIAGCRAEVGESQGSKQVLSLAYPFRLPVLTYAYDALEPAIDAMTMRIHHSRHHQGYVDKLNAALKPYAALQSWKLGALLKRLPALPESVRTAVQNNGGGHFNHTFFWMVLSPNGSGKPTGALGQALIQTFGSFHGFKTQFERAATGLFGSGWVWLVRDDQRNLQILQTAQQDTPLALGLTPIFGLDVWEHAYYLQYQNRRADYVANIWNVVNWRQCERNYTERL